MTERGKDLMSNSASEKTILVGIDGGGSKCLARLETLDGTFLGSGLGGPANPLHGLERAQNSIVTSVANALEDAGMKSDQFSNVIAGVALAGVNLPSLYNVMMAWDHPFKSIYLTTDLHAACLGAHRGQDGAVIVVGTGSCGYLSMGNESLVLGAHGFLLGDMGSGAWIGLEAVKAILLADDNLGPQTKLTAAVCEKLDTDPLGLIEHLSKASSNEFAKLAPLVFAAVEQGDELAAEIIRVGAAYIESVANQLLESNPPRLSMIGGISPLLFDWFDEALIERISPPLEQPEQGALYFARAELEKANERAGEQSLVAS
jgi:glucosamine kinase